MDLELENEKLRKQVIEFVDAKQVLKFPLDFRLNSEWLIRCLPYVLDSTLVTVWSDGYSIPCKETESEGHIQIKIKHLESDCRDVQMLADYENFEQLIRIATKCRLLVAARKILNLEG